MKLNYILNGSKDETVLFLHGWGADLNSFNFFSNQLKTNYQTLQVDFCGFGKSEKLDFVFTVFDYACEIYKLLKQLNINKVSIVAHSFGVRVAILLSTIFNLKINKLVFIGGAGIKPRFNIIKTFKIYKYKMLKTLNKVKIFHFNLNKFGSDDYKNLNETMKKTFVNVVNFDEKHFLKLLNANTLLIWGSADHETPLYMGKTMHKKIRKSKLVVVKNAGHFCFLTHANFVNFQIENFLEN